MDWNTMEVVVLTNGVEERTKALKGPLGYLVGEFCEDKVIARVVDPSFLPMTVPGTVGVITCETSLAQVLLLYR